MQDTHALPLEFVREIFAALSGTTVVDFDEEDFSSTLPATVTVSAFFGTSHCPTDVQQAVNSAFPYPAGPQQRVDALVVVRGNGLDISRHAAIQDALRRKVHGSLFISVSKSNTLPPGTASIILLALHNKTKKTPPPFLKLVVKDEAQQPE